MTTKTETVAAAWERRNAARGSVDFTMMYVAHDAFGRDLAQLAAAAREGRVGTPAVVNTWTLFVRQLHIHHNTEDTSLWPLVRAAAVGPRDSAILDAMEAEHATLEPLITSVDGAVRGKDASALVTGLDRLAANLSAHTRHEEDEALPLIERRIGQAGWDRFGEGIRRVQGIRGGAVYVPWVLDRAPDHVGRAVRRQLPVPVRVLYRLAWEPRYRKAEHL